MPAMNRFQQICLGMVVLSAASLRAQVNNPQPLPAYGMDTSSDDNNDRMQTPPPVSGMEYPTAFTSEEHSNYLRGGVLFTTAYTDNALGTLVNGHPVSDVSYSVAPIVALDETTPRMHLVGSYAPGFTFYQHTSERNEADQNAAITLQYRLSPHLTLSARDSFQKSSSAFNQPDLSSGGEGVSGGSQDANFSVIAPIANLLRNSGVAGLDYQFGRNGMVGASGTFSTLHYPDPAQVPGLYDSSSQGGIGFYSLRVSKMNYLGATYQYQRLLSYPTEGATETQTHAILLFYSLYATSRLSVSVFGGPQHSDTVQPLAAEARSWTPAVGASLSWQAPLTSLAASYSHVISGGGGLVGAVHLDSANASVRQQVTKALSLSFAGTYTQNNVLGATLPGASSGHSLSATAILQQRFGQYVSLQLGYSRLHQDYSDVTVISETPNTNREFVSLSYQFSRPLGR
jgi:hypothetical protein